MAFNTSGTGTVNISGQVQATTTGVNLTALSNSRAGTGSTTIGTVPASKTWKIYGFTLQADHKSASTNQASLLFNGVQVAGTGGSGYVGAGTLTDYGIYGQSLSLIPNYILLTATQTVVLTTGANAGASATIFYTEQDA